MAICIEGDSADELWRNASSMLFDENESTIQNSRLGPTRELLHVVLSIKNAKDRWVMSRNPGMNPAFAIAEVFWILSGSDNAPSINFWNPALPRFAGRAERYHGAYGFRLRRKFGFDQLNGAFETLRDNPDSRQVVVQIWDASVDFPLKGGKPAAEDIPCNIFGMLKLRQGKLDWSQTMRSNDIFRGTPYNIVQFTMLQEILAGWLGCAVGTYTQYCDSLHLYEKDLQIFSLGTAPALNCEVDSLALPKKESEEVIDNMIALLDELTLPSLSPRRFDEIINDVTLPISYKNLLCIAAADAARRRGWLDAMADTARSCTNSVLLEVWKKWETSRAGE